MLIQTTFLILLTFNISLPTSFAQGLPKIRNYTVAEYGGHNRNFDIEVGEDGTVFVANFEGLLYFDRVNWHMIHTPDFSRITVIYRDRKNFIWVGGNNFIARLQKRTNGQLFMQQLNKGEFEGEVIEIFEDSGSLQFAVSDDNIYEVHDDKIALKKHLNINLQIGVDRDIVSVKALLEGREDAVLEDITQTELLDGGLQVKVKKNQGLIVADKNGHELYTITEDDGLCSNQVAVVDYDGHGLLWGATAHGIFAIELPSVYTYYLPKDGFTGEVQAITAYNGKIYVGSTNGLYSIASCLCKRIPEIDNICWALCESRDGLLAATSSGIFIIRSSGSISRLTSTPTTALMVKNDKIYTGEPDGVYVYQSGFRRRTSVNNLPLVMEIRDDGRDGLWFRNVNGQTVGVNPGNPQEPLADLSKHLSMPIKGLKFTTYYHYGDQIWMGGDEILTIIDTGQEELTKLTDSRTIHFRSIVMDNDSVLWGGYGDMPKELPRFNSDERHLHFSYALDFAPLTGTTLYRHRLNNDDWSGWSKRQDVDFPNQPYGSYTLSIQARLANGELSDVASIKFSIAYPLLMRWYMVIFYFFIFAYLISLLFRYRLKKLEKDKIKLEKIVEERTADLRNAQNELIRQEKMATVGKLTEGLIDRILNPMNYIINFSKMSIDLLKDLKADIENNKENINEEDYLDTEDILGMLTENLQNVDQYGNNTTRTLKAMENMLKDRTGGYADMDLLPILQQNEQMLNNYFAKEIEHYGIRTVFNLPTHTMPINGNGDMLSKTIMSLLGNAIYAVIKKAQRMPYSPEVSLVVTITNGQYVLTIRDNGIGIEENLLEKIFDPFFTTKTTDEGAGIGLYLSREIIQNHSGDISVASVKDKFTEFTITLPMLKT